MQEIQKVQDLMGDQGVDAWLISNHGSDKVDPYFSRVISSEHVIAYTIITQDKVHMIVSSLDADKLDSNNYDSFQVFKSGDEALSKCLQEIMRQENLKNIALNYSSPNINDISVDVLGHGECMNLQNKIKKIQPDIEIISAEELIYGLVDVKSESEIEKMVIAQKRADQILRDAFKRIKVGMTETEVAEIVHGLFEEKPDNFEGLGVISEDYSWPKNQCPIVLTGENFTKGGHAKTSDTIIEAGNTIYFDFGVKLEFSDGSKWSSDIQRMGYVLKEGEIKAPDDIQNLFDIIYDSISAGINGFKPGMTGQQADEIVRKVINERSGTDYDHATGHPIGEEAHGPGVILGAKNPRRILKLNNGGVYTIEPRIAIKNGISIEEMVVVTKERNYVIGERQTKLIYIK